MRRNGDLVREVKQLVRRVAHCREDADNAVSFVTGGDEPGSDALQLLGVADGGAAELHHDRAEVRGLRIGIDCGDGFVLGRGHANECRHEPGTSPRNGNGPRRRP